MDQKSRQSSKQGSKWEQKYNTLLEKNQNDLIKIRLREKQLNETIKKLENERQKIKFDFQEKIKVLQAEIQKLKEQRTSEKLQTEKFSNLREKDKFNVQQNEIMKKIGQYKDLETKFQNLQIELQNTKKQNIKLTYQLKDYQESSKNSTKIVTQNNEKIQNINQKAKQLQKKVNELQRQKQKQRDQIKELEQQKITELQKRKSIEHQVKVKQREMKREQQNLFTEVQRLRQLLTLTDVQYKNLVHKEQLKEQLIKQKNDQLNMMTQQLIDMQQKLQKSKQFEAYRAKYDQEWTRRQQLQQQNILLKEMIKSHKTMLKIKENQIDRLKQKVQLKK